MSSLWGLDGHSFRDRMRKSPIQKGHGVVLGETVVQTATDVLCVGRDTPQPQPLLPVSGSPASCPVRKQVIHWLWQAQWTGWAYNGGCLGWRSWELSWSPWTRTWHPSLVLVWTWMHVVVLSHIDCIIGQPVCPVSKLKGSSKGSVMCLRHKGNRPVVT